MRDSGYPQGGLTFPAQARDWIQIGMNCLVVTTALLSVLFYVLVGCALFGVFS